MTEITRAEHMKWCKKRANEYIAMGDLANAVASMLRDLTKHEGTKNLADSTLGAFLAMDGMMAAGRNDVTAVTNWVNGFTE